MWTADHHTHIGFKKGKNSEGQLQTIYMQMFSAAAQSSLDVMLHTDTLKRCLSACSMQCVQHGFLAPPYSCGGSLVVKLIINLCPGLWGLYDWQSCSL